VADEIASMFRVLEAQMEDELTMEVSIDQIAWTKIEINTLVFVSGDLETSASQALTAAPKRHSS